ncbi:hypothetical protein KUL72_29560 [Bradyrhizobium arachidis]|uniref:hypothetical protein n=1 Tax=Bradyrhizobium arachidis TaxID=858423 RepID=UPI002162C0DA|nr:hypothetical protein [Bradyrhizobium arachidis]UVO35550.1 hypothetical protein KUL72_29560 [Bradyrhizobium arachidis]
MFKAQCDRGIFETNIVAIVSRVEAFIQDCLRIAILDKPEKLVLIGDKNIPLNLFLELEDRDVLLEAVIESRCQELLFAKPKDYLEKFAKVLSIDIKSEILESFIEMKASRDVIVHNRVRSTRSMSKKPEGKDEGRSERNWSWTSHISRTLLKTLSCSQVQFSAKRKRNTSESI